MSTNEHSNGLSMPRIVSPELTSLIERKDWAATPLGPQSSWSPALRTMLDVVLANRFPTVFWWGPELVQLYNDPFRPILGAKHPAALGQPASECWVEIWSVLGEFLEPVIEGRESAWAEDFLYGVDRHGFVEECLFTFAYSPIPDATAPNGVGGVLCTVQETSQRVIGERRMMLLRDLGARSSDAKTVNDACAIAADVLGRYAKDLPFALIYLVDDERATAHLAATAGVADREHGYPATIRLDGEADPWHVARTLRQDTLVAIPGLRGILDVVPPGPWPEAPHTAVALPIKSNLEHQPFGVLVTGVSARLTFDEAYRGFLELVCAQIATAIARARAYDDERRRAEALAEIDRAKIAFFSNVSHEFRTPLTLMLGPLDDLARMTGEDAAPLVETAKRNALRLLRLVNTLLDFSRIEAGRAEAAFETTDLSALTRELASAFESGMARAGLRYLIDAGDVGSVAVDRLMWEKIVLNLLSNALKFTFDGEVRLRLSAVGDLIELCVTDTGSGIPDADMPHVFERFRRVRGTRSRSHEGTGIGLALVKELVALHHGTTSVESSLGEGATFTILIPRGRVLAADAGSPRPAPPSGAVDQYLADVASTMLPRNDAGAAAAPPGNTEGRVLLVDDNADLRTYVMRLLSPRFDVAVATNGVDALRIARTQPVDLILSDVMMPVMDGLELLAAVRSDKDLERIPFILLSARAGEDSAVAGLSHGADDYLVKPFSSGELQARVAAHVNASTIRERAYRAIERTSREAQHVADVFQRAALPAGLPQVDWASFDSVYQAGADEAKVGGDWFDALVLGDGRIMVSIGDVVGHGLEAAVTMSRVREIMRGAAQIHADPLAILDAGDKALKAENAEALVTAFVGIYDGVERTMTFASAGHPHPLLRLPSHEIVELATTGLPLGLRRRDYGRSAMVRIPLDSVLVLYTDGLTEATRDVLAGEARLRRVVEKLDDDESSFATAIYDGVLDRHAQDDVAILTMRTIDANRGTLDRWTFDAHDEGAAALMREEIAEFLRGRGIAEDGVYVDVILAELLGNVVRYAPGPVDLALQWLTQAPIIHVLDRGPGFAQDRRWRSDPGRGGGRGLRVVDALCKELSITDRPGGGSHVRAALLTSHAIA